MKSVSKRVYGTEYARKDDESYRWIDKIKPRDPKTVLDEDPFEIIEDRYVTAVPDDAAVYVPKHVKYPRSHLRTFLKTIGGRITIKPEDADIAIIDPVWYNDHIKTVTSKYNVAEVYDHRFDETHTDILIPRHTLRQHSYAYTILDPNVYIGFDRGCLTVGDDAALDDFIELVRCNTAVQFIKYDDLFDQASGGAKIDHAQFLTLAQAIYSDGDVKNAEVYLGAMSRYSVNHNMIELAALLMMMRFMKLPYLHEFRKLIRSTFYYNLLNRVTRRIAHKISGSARILTHHSFISGYTWMYVHWRTYETVLARVLKSLHHDCFEKGIPFPERYVRFYLTHQYKGFATPEQTGDREIFKAEYKNQVLNYLDQLDKDDQYNGNFVINTPGGFRLEYYRNKFESDVLDHRYYLENREFVRSVLSEL